MAGQFKTDDVCGSLAGVKRHYYRRTEMCQPCRTAEREYQARARQIARQRRQRKAGI